MTSTRTDIHRPSSEQFDPQQYDCLGVFDLSPEWGDNGARMRAVNRAVESGASFAGAPHGSGQCSHCGTRIRYAALMLHVPTRTLLYVGETCLDVRFSQTKAEFQRTRREAIARQVRGERRARIDAMIAEHPLLAWLTYGQYTINNSFLFDVGRKFLLYGELTPRQIEAVERAIIRDTQEDDRRAAAAAAVTEPAPTGRVVVEGTLATIRTQDGYYGPTVKMRVVTDAGWAVWCPLPSGLSGANKGARVRFTATLTPSDDDPTFAYGKRPTLAAVVD
jgi:hypothetical protein